MSVRPPDPAQIDELARAFPGATQVRAALARYTSARIGGPADVLLTVGSRPELERAVTWLWQAEIPFRILGGGSNVLVSDAGVRGVVILNRARGVRFEQQDESLLVWAESGTSIGNLARRAAERGWSGLEWAATVPGTVGGALVGNAGAHGGDVAGCLRVAEILQPDSEIESWDAARMAFRYRGSALKDASGTHVVLEACFELQAAEPEHCKARMAEFAAQRTLTQPPGASMGSMFKNPSGDYAGRLIELAGLKGLRQGAAQISPLHANFFVNLGGARAVDVWTLLQQARMDVSEAFGIELEMEIELFGDWQSVFEEQKQA